MINCPRLRVIVCAFAASAAFAVAGVAAAQSEAPHKPGAPGMQGCPMMRGGGMGHGMPHLPPGNEKLEMQMHADMMRAMADVLTKYAARLPDKK
jgi:Spy/CpxP family protein refolding chaperone